MVQTCTRKWINGKWSYAGNKHLKKTQSYPIAFGLAVLRRLPDFVRGPAGCPEISELEDATKAFAAMPWGDLWREADIISACAYIRGGKHLNTSFRWKQVYPTEYPP